jgi:hypothetical protein
MESIHGDDATFEQITACTKYIRVYSDNPIHNQIDRIIDACSYVDEGGDNLYFYLSELKDAAEELTELTIKKLLVESDKIHKLHNEQKSNQA